MLRSWYLSFESHSACWITKYTCSFILLFVWYTGWAKTPCLSVEEGCYTVLEVTKSPPKKHFRWRKWPMSHARGYHYQHSSQPQELHVFCDFHSKLYPYSDWWTDAFWLTRVHDTINMWDESSIRTQQPFCKSLSTETLMTLTPRH